MSASDSGHGAVSAAGTDTCSGPTLAGCTIARAMPTPLLSAARAARIDAPAMPSVPPTIATRRRVPLCALTAIGGTRDATHARSTSVARTIVERGVRPKSDVDDDDASAAIAPHERAAFHRAERDREIGRHRDVTRAGGRIEPARHVERDDARAGIAQLLQCDESRRRSHRAELPRSRCPGCRRPRRLPRRSVRARRRAHARSDARHAHRRSSPSATSTTRTETPTAASAAATTHASPPLFPGPAKTATPCAIASPKARAISAAAAAPARCMSARDGTPPSMAARSRAADCAAVTTCTVMRLSSGRVTWLAADGETAARWPPRIAAGLLFVRLTHGPARN